ncbi:hypothetical protein [Burkholderia ubonensis]|uniref:hypothetical protein n=1 Tax=Burkholderia ubonensis TaxID=101571 RepID=UPI0002F8E927
MIRIERGRIKHCATAIVMVAIATVLQALAMRAGVTALTAPFVLASWLTVWVMRRFTLGDADVVIRSPS